MGAGIELFPKTTKRVKAKLAEMLTGVDIDDLKAQADGEEAEPPNNV